MFSESELIDKLLKIEALYTGATTLGEKEAAQAAMHRIQAKLAEQKDQDPIIKWRITNGSRFEKKLLIALLKRYGFRPYRYYRQKYTTVRVDMTRSFMDDVFWPEYLEMKALLREHLNAITDKIIKQAISDDDSEEEVQEGPQQIAYQ